VIAAATLLLYIASINGFELSGNVVTDPVEGKETQPVENPAPPNNPAFPAPKIPS
jgi:hypothetical protein